uniref:DNA-directed DNA polymerase n=1 Tax=Globodera pallida TaxID=36090 RepID=A0A183CIT5_GLOPA
MDVIKDSVTIASIVMKIFRAKFLKERHIPIVPEGGFEKAENQSKIAVKYFEWLAYRDGVKVRHACNGGEVEFGRFKVDCVIGAQKKIVEFQECDVKEELKKNREMKRFFDSVPDKGPINPRDAYAGGRTMPFCLFAAASEKVEIAMFDIISLYPFVNYDTPYPVGIPKIIKNANYNVLWTCPEDVPYDGLLKVKVIPPKKLLYPLLSVHIDDMLLFPNCGICARRAKKEFVLAKDVKRKALELGYKVIGFYRAYHFEEFDSQLFKNYVRMFLKIKVQASGWPLDVKTEEEKRDFIDMYRAKYDIYLEYDNIRKNPEKGRRGDLAQHKNKRDHAEQG